MRKRYEVSESKLVHSHGMRWDREGRCFETVNNGPETRRPDCDWGTPHGDLLIEPWVQEALRKT